MTEIQELEPDAPQMLINFVRVGLCCVCRSQSMWGGQTFQGNFVGGGGGGGAILCGAMQMWYQILSLLINHYFDGDSLSLSLSFSLFLLRHEFLNFRYLFIYFGR